MKNLVILLACIAACADDNAPSISIVAIAPEQLVPSDDARDDLMITARYDDGDGDLGTGQALVHDCRGDDLVSELAIPSIAPDAIAGDSPITGELTLLVNDIGPISNAGALPAVCSKHGVAALAPNEAVFCVVLVDAAGHRGAADCTGTIAIQ
jgi:hypothetical protein